MAKLMPVDYDPFMGAAPAAPNFIPVDHDPFASTAAAGPTLIPVDYDPFSDSAAVTPNLVPVDHDPFAGTSSAAPTFIPVDHDPFNDPVAATPQFVPVDHDPFALPASAAEASPEPPSPQASSAGPGIPNSPATPFPDQRAPANRIPDPTMLSSVALNAPVSLSQNLPAFDSLSFNSMPVSFWPRRAPIFPVPAQQFGKPSPGPLSFGPDRGQPDQIDDTAADASKQPDVTSPGSDYEESQPAVILAGDYDQPKKDREKLQEQLDLFNENVWGRPPRFGNKRQVLPIPHCLRRSLALPPHHSAPSYSRQSPQAS